MHTRRGPDAPHSNKGLDFKAPAPNDPRQYQLFLIRKELTTIRPRVSRTILIWNCDGVNGTVGLLGRELVLSGD
ncbi:hypothetical protein CEXT_25231 [Caerostris extrusa]|uniref:Uncharacterized protein n=1 Tax=Caerostris extrusa TaxID=172846 RepID=A0AAV4SAT3_CAEEX|nr:hypothetical protein CEXT_25231 [Caerostris extrusa]